MIDLSIVAQLQAAARLAPVETARRPVVILHRASVYRLLRSKQPTTVQSLADRTGLKRQLVQECLNDLAKDGKAVKAGRNRNGRIDWVRA